MNILENEKDYVHFLIKNELTTNQFLLLYLLYTEKMIKDQHQKLKFTKEGLLYKWNEHGKKLASQNRNNGEGWTVSEIKDIVKKEYAISLDSAYSFDQLILTNKFSDLMIISSSVAFDEILELYPDSIVIKGQTYFLKTGDLDEYASSYSKLMLYSVSKHNQIKEIIKFGKERNMINTNIGKFLNRAVINDLAKKMKEYQINERTNEQEL